MGRGRAVALAIAGGIALAAGAGALAGCGSGGAKQPPGDEIKGRTLTIYSSVPLHGASSVAAHAVVAGEQVALADAHNRIGKYRIVLKPLDDSTPQRGEWDPGQTSTNAHVAMADPTTIGYIGEFNSGASAVSIPLLNRLKIAQISPTSTAVGLTSSGAGASPGEPDKYYPTGRAHVRPDRAQRRRPGGGPGRAAAPPRLPQDLRARRRRGRRQRHGRRRSRSPHSGRGLQIAAVQPFDPHATDYRSLATAVAQTGADCVLISALTENHAVLLTRQLAAGFRTRPVTGSAQSAVAPRSTSRGRSPATRSSPSRSAPARGTEELCSTALPAGRACRT